MTQLNSNFTLALLHQLITDVASGAAHDYTFLDEKVAGPVYVSTHEAVFDADSEVNQFTVATQTFLTKAFGRTVPKSRHNSNEAQYSTFASLFSTQASIVRILWLHGKVLSILVGSKPLMIMGKEKIDSLTYSPYYFGFSPDSKANLQLSDTDKELLMTLSQANWFVSRQRMGVVPNNPDSSKSINIAEGYIRHGGIEKVYESDDLYYLLYPKPNGNFFTSGGSWGSGLPSLAKMMSDFEYNDMLDTQLLCTGEWNRYRDYDNSVFLDVKDITPNVDNKTYYRFSFNSMEVFEGSRRAVTAKDLITRKYSIFTPEDTKKYVDNPRYDVVHSPDKSMFYVCRSDKLKATALQTRITKSLREDFIRFLNWIGYYQLAADLDPAMLDTFVPVKLIDAAKAHWAEPAQLTLANLKSQIFNFATTEYKSLYMGDSGGTVTLLDNCSMFDSVFKQHNNSQQRYSDREHFDPAYMLKPLDQGYSNTRNSIFAFNKKFSLDINIIYILGAFTDMIDPLRMSHDYQRIHYTKPDHVVSFLSTNFIISDQIESRIQGILGNNSDRTSTVKSLPYWHFNYNEMTTSGQLLKTCMTLSPEALAIFNSVATLTTPTDIMSWLELSREHFTKALPEALVAKYGTTIASAKRISAILNTGIEYYMTILSAAEPFSNKMLGTDETGD
jgi:hypothetical protein